MRLMAGLDKPTSGSIWFDGRDVTGKPVQGRNVAMVYQQFINYPAMTVYENIASPLRVAGKSGAEIDREELRAELPKIFAETGAIFVYATTEPSEALLLGGNTATLSEGRVTQFGSTVEVFRRPADLVTARTFSDPPLNTIAATKRGPVLQLAGGAEITAPADLQAIADGPLTVGFRPHHLSPSPQSLATAQLSASVTVTEITGSESFVHLAYGSDRW
eukprot:gene16400-21737_t